MIMSAITYEIATVMPSSAAPGMMWNSASPSSAPTANATRIERPGAAGSRGTTRTKIPTKVTALDGEDVTGSSLSRPTRNRARAEATTDGARRTASIPADARDVPLASRGCQVRRLSLPPMRTRPFGHLRALRASIISLLAIAPRWSLLLVRGDEFLARHRDLRSDWSMTGAVERALTGGLPVAPMAGFWIWPVPGLPARCRATPSRRRT